MKLELIFVAVAVSATLAAASQNSFRKTHVLEEPVVPLPEPITKTCFETADFAIENEFVNGALALKDACWQGLESTDLFKNIKVDIKNFPNMALTGLVDIKRLRASAEEYNGTLGMSAPGFTLGDIWGSGSLLGGFDSFTIRNINATIHLALAEDRCYIEDIHFDQPHWEAMVFEATGLFINGHERSSEDCQAFADALLHICDVFWEFLSLFCFGVLKSFGNYVLEGYTIVDLIEIITGPATKF